MIDRFWSKVDRKGPEECWPWLAGKSPSGYGSFSIKLRGFRAHRVAYELEIGPIPEGLIVRHKCDNPACCNPNHLEVGTNRDNTQDAIRRGRWSPPPIQSKNGASAPRAKLTSDQVIEARRLYHNHTLYQYELARMFGVSQAAMSKIVRGETYPDSASISGAPDAPPR
jgi:hypothetical protein